MPERTPPSLRLSLLGAVGLALNGPQSTTRAAVLTAVLGPEPRTGWAAIAEPFVRIAVAAPPAPCDGDQSWSPCDTLGAIDEAWCAARATDPADAVAEALFTAYRRAVVVAASAQNVDTLGVHDLLESLPTRRRDCA
jgi:hypothetical protein